MTTSLILLAVLVVVGVASVLGRTADSRDPEFGLGRVPHPHRPASAS